MSATHLPVTHIASKSRNCPHCEHTIFSAGKAVVLDMTKVESWDCPHCGEATVYIARIKLRPLPKPAGSGGVGGLYPQTGKLSQVFPRFTRAPKKFGNAPDGVVQLYVAACELAAIYLPAAGAVARRCLEAILRRAGYEQSSIANQIAALSAETDRNKQVSVRLIAHLGALREFGNFAAHEVASVVTGEVIEVEPGEVDLCLAIIEELLDELYERPAIEAAQMATVAARMRAAGKTKVADALEATYAFPALDDVDRGKE